jgi:sodium ion-translocating decarboxylase beta subunit
MFDMLRNYLLDTGFGQFHWSNGVMILIGILFIVLAIRKGFEPLLLVPIGFGILIGNIPYDAMKLNIGVYDGPVAEADLFFYALEVESVELKRHGGGLITYDQAIDWINHNVRVGDMPPVTADSYDGLMSVMRQARRVNIRPGTLRQVVPSEGEELLDIGAAVMVNKHSTLTYRVDGHTPAFIEFRQGRMAFVPEIHDDRKYFELWSRENQNLDNAGAFWMLYRGIAWGVFPPLIFLGIGALTDFGPLLAQPRMILLGAAAQFGIFGALFLALIVGFSGPEAASIGIIGGADGPTSIFVCSQLAPPLLGAVALSAYSYMAMVPIIQPPIMRLLTTRQERLIRMEAPHDVPKTLKIMFPVIAFLLTAFIAPGAIALLGMLFFGNLLRESLVTDRLAKTASTSFIDIVTILLGITVGAKTAAGTFLTLETIYIFALGMVAFSLSTAGGVLLGKLMCHLTGGKVNPLLGAAGVSAVPMAARVVQRVAQEEDPQNFLLMHAMGPNVAGVIGSAVAAGVLLSYFA